MLVYAFNNSFDGLESEIKVVRDGADAVLGVGKDGRTLHTPRNVYKDMLISIMCTYNCLPNPRTLSGVEIENLYDGIRHHLKKAT